MFLNILLLKAITKYTFSFIANIKRMCESNFVEGNSYFRKNIKGKLK